jgi:hypothetical protein
MEKGQQVTVETFDHRLIDCRLVEVREKTAVVCSEQEWHNATREKREPQCLGWPMSSVQIKKGVTAS